MTKLSLTLAVLLALGMASAAPLAWADGAKDTKQQQQTTAPRTATEAIAAPTVLRSSVGVVTTRANGTQ